MNFTAQGLAGPVFWVTVAHILARGSLILAAILLARALTPASFAAYAYFQLTIGMLAAYAALGMTGSASRLFAEAVHQDSGAPAPPMGTLWMLGCLAAPLAGLAMLIAPEGLVGTELGVPRIAMALGVAALVLGVVPGGAILGLGKFRHATWASAAAAFVLLLGAAMSARASSAVLGMWSLAASFLVLALAQSMVVIRSVGWARLRSGTVLDWPSLRRVLGVAWPLFLVSLVTASGAWVVGRMMLSGPDGEHGFAFYTIGLQWYALTLLLPLMMARVVLPRMVQSRLQADRDQARATVATSLQLAILLALACLILVAAAGNLLAALYGPAYADGRWYLTAFVAAGALQSPVAVLSSVAIGSDRHWEWLLLNLVWLGVLLAAAALLSDSGKWSGTMALVVANVVMCIMAVFRARAWGYL